MIEQPQTQPSPAISGTLLRSGEPVRSYSTRAERERNLRSTPKGRPSAGFCLTGRRPELTQSPPVRVAERGEPPIAESSKAEAC